MCLYTASCGSPSHYSNTVLHYITRAPQSSATFLASQIAERRVHLLVKSVGIRATSLLPATLTKTTLPHVRLCLKTRSAVALLPILPDRTFHDLCAGPLARSCFKNKSIGAAGCSAATRTRHDGIHGWPKGKGKREM